MDLVKTPMKGMPEQTPAKMEIRNYLKSKILDIYLSYGFLNIDTPAIENIQNLMSKQGGENEQLIFKILKRGEKLKEGMSINEVFDCGLRYDLTVPLTRFYANNQEELPIPFKAFQIGDVWRADRPQKGRFRQFTQCDIDIIGDSTNLAEIELILATYKVLCALGFKDAIIRVNDRNILKELASHCGFEPEDFDNLFIIVDKLDKIGIDGIKKEMLKMGYDNGKVEKYLSIYKDCSGLEYSAKFLKSKLGKESEYSQNLDDIIKGVRELTENGINVVFDPTLVRGMGYYTGPIFEIQLKPYNYSVGGGGRYDKMVGKYLGQDVPACGFSLGFERLVDIMFEKGFKVPNKKRIKVFFIEKDCPINLKKSVLNLADILRHSNIEIIVAVKSKNFFHQKQQFEKNGIFDFNEFSSLEDIANFK